MQYDHDYLAAGACIGDVGLFRVCVTYTIYYTEKIFY